MADADSISTLPKSMYLRSGRYYIAKRDAVTKKLVWTALSKNLGEALAQYRLLSSGKAHEAFDQYGAPSHWLSTVAKDLHEQSRKRAREADIMFTLTLEDVMQLGIASNWRCAVTGMKFRQDKIEGAAMRPYMPSIDRIFCSRGYSKDNCRLVCVATNFALNNWGEGVLRELSMAYVKHNGAGAR